MTPEIKERYEERNYYYEFHIYSFKSEINIYYLGVLISSEEGAESNTTKIPRGNLYFYACDFFKDN